MARTDIKRITLIERTPDGFTTKTLFEAPEEKKRKVSRGLRGMEKAERRVLEAVDTFAGELLDRHNRSTRKRKDGWLRDGQLNLMKAQRKAIKKLTRF